MRAFLILTMMGISGNPGGDTKGLRYLRLDGEQWVPESAVTSSLEPEGTVYVSVTTRASEKMTLTIAHDKKGRLLGAEALLATKQGKKRASLKIDGKWGILKRGGVTEQFMLPADVVVTTAPDWSDIFQVLRRYDRARGGKQEFPGFWIHPVQPPRVLTFTVEKLGEDTIAVKDRKLALGRYRVTLRSGAYLVWADAAGLVHKLMPAGRAAGTVVLEGFEEATQGLK
jgi:hypothetical protein